MEPSWFIIDVSVIALSQGNIQILTPFDLDKYEAHAWLLSPPCQPYTRQGCVLKLFDVAFCIQISLPLHLICVVFSRSAERLS